MDNGKKGGDGGAPAPRGAPMTGTHKRLMPHYIRQQTCVHSRGLVTNH